MESLTNMPKVTKELIRKFEIGDPLTDNECRALYDFFAELQDSLSLMGAEYHIAWVPIMHKRNAVEGYLRARNKNV
jgi:hypothetical protein